MNRSDAGYATGMTSEEPTTTEAPAPEAPATEALAPEAPATETETTTVVHETEKPAEPAADPVKSEAAAAHEESRSNEEKSAAKSAVEENAAAQFAEAEKPVTDQKSE